MVSASEEGSGLDRACETGLDYFLARYFSGAQGRFTSPDPENASAFLYPDDPQSWNGYSYGRNNPLLYVDPDGMNYRVCDTEGHCRDNVTDEEWNKIVTHNLMNVRPGHIPPPGGMAEAQSAVEGAIRTGNYLLKGNGLFEGTTQINGVAVGFRGRFVDGVARVATVFTKR